MLTLWDISKDMERAYFLEGHSNGVIALAFSSDEKLMASASHDRRIWLWHVGQACDKACEADFCALPISARSRKEIHIYSTWRHHVHQKYHRRQSQMVDYFYWVPHTWVPDRQRSQWHGRHLSTTTYRIQLPTTMLHLKQELNRVVLLKPKARTISVTRLSFSRMVRRCAKVPYEAQTCTCLLPQLHPASARSP